MGRKTDKQDIGSLADLLWTDLSFDRYAQLYPSIRSRLREISTLDDPAITAKTDLLVAMIARKDKENRDWFIQRFRLTPAQARVAVHVVTGGSMADYARKTGTSLHTVRTHLKAVFAKTGASRQVELAHILRDKRNKP